MLCSKVQMMYFSLFENKKKNQFLKVHECDLGGTNTNQLQDGE